MQHPKPRSSLARRDNAQPRLRRRTILSLAGALCVASPVALGLVGYLLVVRPLRLA